MKATCSPVSPASDIGLLGMWMTCNYGAVLTSYALYRVLENMGKNVTLLDFSYTDRQKDSETVFRKFLVQEGLSVTSMHNLENAYVFNDHFDTFMVGSDQVWNQGFLGHLFFLDFAKGEKRKIAYGPSMAEQNKPQKKCLKKNKLLLKRFDAVSVREKSLIGYLRRYFDCDSTWVIDPVFLLTKNQWMQLPRQTIKENIPIVSYILDPTDTKRSLLLDISSKIGKPLLNMIDIQKEEINNYKLLNLPNTIEETTLYDWIDNIARCQYFITDSYHGICFALIFNKPFICINNSLRGSGRFHSLLGLLNLQYRMLPENAFELPEGFLLDIDYNVINSILKPEIDRSKQWLLNSLTINRSTDLEKYSRKSEKRLTKRPPSYWKLCYRRTKKMLTGIYHRFIH